MKKFLSLVLALVMTMSLVTVSAGAKDFSDDGWGWSVRNRTESPFRCGWLQKNN